MFIRILRSPEGADSAGAAVVEAADTATADNVVPENLEADSTQQPKAEKPKASDWERYEKLKEKQKDPNAKFTRADIALSKKYNGKDESEIQGYKAPEQLTEDDESSTPEVKEDKKPEVKENPLHKLVGAKTDADVVPKVQGLVEELRKFSTERSEFGRIFESMGAKNPQEAKTYVKHANALNLLVQDLKAGKAEAFAFIGVKGAPAAQEQFSGELPDNILDEGLFKHMSPLLKAANDRADKLERELAQLKGEWAPIRETNQKTAANSERIAQVNDIVSEFTRVLDVTEGLWDSKKDGSFSKALHDYYSTTGDFNPALKPILEILEIAKSNRIDNIEIALHHWERKNGRQFKGIEQSKQPFMDKKPSVGLSDQQGNHNGQFKTYTEASIKDRIARGVGAPPEWLDQTGTIVMDRVPPALRHLVE